MEDTWIKEAYLEKGQWEWRERMDPSCHNPITLDRCMNSGMPYHYADQVWKVGSGEKSWTLWPILH